MIPHRQSIHGSEAEKRYKHSQAWTGLYALMEKVPTGDDG